MVAADFVPPLLGAVPAAGEREVRSAVAVTVNKLGGHIAAEYLRKMREAFGVVLFICYANSSGLQILYTLLQDVAQEEAAAQSFCQTYFCDILQHIFSVVTDASHTAGKMMQVKLFVTGVFSLSQDIPAFREHLRDFLLQITVSLAWVLKRSAELFSV
ncbi:hypothetical protein ASZ78_001198 [Callipepla squamata]|uniref:Exportin-1 C-terminal domain-containing protein n=1 Tax=Callipepla squamata TaxID=9009 RepID=A0A226MBT7_CALSU|nr:hypothetical protein ASZ78_001198 [Callipepla squamata]